MAWKLTFNQIKALFLVATKRPAFSARIWLFGPFPIRKGVWIKKWNVLIQAATYVVSCFKQTSGRLLDLSKIMFYSPN